MMKSVYVDALATLVIRGITLGIRVAGFILLAKISEQSLFGQLAYLMAYTEIFRILADMGLDTYNIRTISQSDSSQNDYQILSIAASQKFCMGTFWGGIYILIFSFLEPNVPLKYVIAFAMLSITPSFINFSVNFYLAKSDLFQLIPQTIILAFILMIVYGYNWYHANPFGCVISILVGELCIAFVNMKKLFKHIHFHINFSSIISNIKCHHAIGMAMLIATIYSRLDIVFVEKTLGSNSTALYGLAQRLTEPALFIVGALSSNIYSAISKLILTQQKKYVAKQITRIVCTFLGFGCALALATILVSQFIIQHFYLNYMSATTIIFILSLSVIFKAANLAFTSTILALGYFKITTIINCFNLFSSVILIFGLLKMFGLPGAALGVLSVEFINSILQAVIVRKLFLLQYNNMYGNA